MRMKAVPPKTLNPFCCLRLLAIDLLLAPHKVSQEFVSPSLLNCKFTLNTSRSLYQSHSSSSASFRLPLGPSHVEQIEPGLAETPVMGSVLSCACLSAKTGDVGNRRKLRKPKPWKHTDPITRSQLQSMREEFWDTAPHYGGRREIWDALRAASEADLSLAQLIVDSAGVILMSDDMSTCYDERGAKYDLPKYVLSEPVNILKSD